MSDLEIFKALFKGDVVTPRDAGYDIAIARWAKNAARKAAVVAFAKDAEDVSRAVAYARTAKLPIAIKGGGHSPLGASSSEGGLVIDLSRYMNTAQVDPVKRLAYVGGGAIWESVDKAAIEHGLATVGGTVNNTGVGGLTLGGGYGWLSGAHGLALDNLVQATVVTADSRILMVNESENADLFWGIRGAGSNFGVVTEFVLKLHPQRRTVFAGPVIFSPDKLEALLDVTQAWWTMGPSEKEGMIQVLTRGPGHMPCIVAFLFYNGSEAEGRQNYKAFYDLQPIADMAQELPYEMLNTLQNEATAAGQNVYMKGCFAPRNYPREVIPQLFERVVQLSAPTTHKITFLLEYFPLHKINSVPDDATAYRRGLSANAVCLVFADDDSETTLKTSRNVAHELIALLTGKDADNLGYGNYSPDSEGVPTDGSVVFSKAAVNFGSNYTRLQQIKRAYDPEVVFNKWFAITPA